MMRQFWTTLVAAGVLAIGVSHFVSANPGGRGHAYESFGEVITATDSTSTSFTLTGAQLSGYSKLAVYTFLDYTAATALSMTCSVSVEGRAEDFTLQSCSVSSGTCTSSNASWSKAISGADAYWVWVVDLVGIPSSTTVCTFTDTGGTSDKISVWATAMVD